MQISIDIESMDAKDTAVVLSVGIAAFNFAKPYDCCIESAQDIYLPIADQIIKHNRTVSGKTMEWHFKTDANNITKMLNRCNTEHKRKSLETAVGHLHQIIGDLLLAQDEENQTVWMRSPSFDGIILGKLFNQFGKDKPWKFRNERDVRTFVETAKLAKHFVQDEMPQPTATLHNAMSDAIYQSEYLVWCNNWINNFAGKAE